MGNGRYIFTYEMGNAEQSLAAGYAVHYRVAADPETFQDAAEVLLQSSSPDRYISNSGPFVVWTPVGPKGMGTVVVSDSFYNEVFMNFDYGDPGKWVTVNGTHGLGYSRSLLVMPDQSKVLLVNGGRYGENDTMVTAGIIDVPGTLGEGVGWEDTLSSCDGKGFWNS